MKTRFQKLAFATLIATYLLILFGALVRASGAGMGCPDWPQCFGRWIPPTSLSQVPIELAAQFNVRLAWTEYLNRLLGTSTGILVFGTLVLAIVDHRKNARVLWSSVGAFVSVGLAGWLGKRVVQGNLDPAMVTVHMFVALAVVGFLIYGILWASERASTEEPNRKIAVFSLAVIGVTMVQIAIGTRVRSSIEMVSRARPILARGQWIEHIGNIDGVHRTAGLLVLILTVALAVYVRRIDANGTIRAISAWIVLGVISQMAAGIALAYASLPPIFQVFHVGMASAILGGLIALAVLASRTSPATAHGLDSDPAFEIHTKTPAGQS